MVEVVVFVVVVVVVVLAAEKLRKIEGIAAEFYNSMQPQVFFQIVKLKKIG